jgi:hypothetical protein
LALGESEWTASRAGHFIPEGKAPVFIERDYGWKPESAWTLQKNENFLLLQETELQTFGTGDDSALLL